MTETTPDPFDLKGQEETARDLARKSQLEARTEAEDIKWLMSGKRGRRIMWRLLDRAGIFRSSFTGNSETYFREGQRNVGLIYMGHVHEYAPEAYTAMVEENRAKS